MKYICKYHENHVKMYKHCVSCMFKCNVVVLIYDMWDNIISDFLKYFNFSRFTYFIYNLN